MKKIILLVLIIILALPLGMSSAQEPGTKEDNACNEGGSMAGKCETAWHWVCGWYLARWEANGGWNTPNNRLNDACLSLLPPQDTSVASPVCFLIFGAWNLCFADDGTSTADLIFSPIKPDYKLLATTFILPGICPVGTVVGFPVFILSPQQQEYMLSLGYSTNSLLCYGL